ncbi:MAG: sensor histidine kinase, partial [Myxococcota bacterium]
EDLRAAADDGRVEHTGLRVRKDGSRFRAHTILTAVRDANGRLLGYSKVTRDLTERELSEEALRRSEERFRLIVESVVDYAIFMLDADGRVATWNIGARRIKGYETEEIVGSPYARFFLPEDVAAGKPARALAIAAAEGRWAEEGWRVRKDGTRFYASIVLTALRDATGRLVGYGKVTRDITERLLAEEALRTTNETLAARSAALEAANAQLERANAQLEQANRELEWLSYAISHDLRAPLRKISAATTLLDHPDRSPEERVQLDRLHGATRTIDQVIGGMLVLAGVRRAALAPGAVDLAAIARAVVEDLRAADPTRVVTTAVPDTLPAHGDAALVRIILDNLLRNAWKFTARTAEARIEVGADGDGWYVRDNGAGFDMARAQRLFSPFERLHHAADFEGTGIGLATVRAAVLRHGGAISAEAAPGKGATFRFTLGPPSAG